MITGCTNNPPLKSNPDVPKIKEVRSLSDRNAIALEWDIVNKPEIAGYYIQRSNNAKKYKTIAKITDKYIAHFTDTNLQPNKVYYYKISTFTKQGVPSFAKFKKIKTLPTIDSVPFVADAGLKVKGMIKLIFRPNPNERVKGYIIERFNDEKGKWEELDRLEPRLRAEYIDKDLIDGKVYRYRIISYTFDGLKSSPSKEIAIQTLQKPQVITSISATTNLPKKIELKWQKIPNALEYKIYISNNEDGSYTFLSSTKVNHYVDDVNKDGITRFYKISSINKYGIESLKSQPVMGATLQVPSKPIVSIQKNKNSVKFILSSPDKRAVKYLIKKNDGEKIINIHNVKNPFVDKNIKHKKTYTYEVFALDKYDLKSKPTKVEVNF